MRKKVLFLVNSLAGGGAERVCVDLARELTVRYEVDFVTLYPEGDYGLPEGVRHYCLHLSGKGSALERGAEVIRARKKFDSLIAERESNGPYALITVHLPMPQLLARVSRVIRNRALFVVHLPLTYVFAQTFGLHKSGSIGRFACKMLYGKTPMVAVSDGVRNQMIHNFGFRDNRVRTIFNPVPFEKIILMSRDYLSMDRPFILVVGRLTEQKRIDRAIEVFARGGFYRSYDLVIAGQGPKQEEYRRVAQNCGHGDAVRFVGFQDNPYAWIARSSALLLTSDAEALPMVLIEGLLLGAHVVSSDCDFGPREILTGDLQDYLVRPDDIDGYIAALSKALIDYPTVSNDFIKRYSANYAAGQYLDFYRTAFGSVK